MDAEKILATIRDKITQIECLGYRPANINLGYDVYEVIVSPDNRWLTPIELDNCGGPIAIYQLPFQLDLERRRRITIGLPAPHLAKAMKNLELDMDWPEDEETPAPDRHSVERVVEIGPLRYPVKRVDQLFSDTNPEEKLAGKIRYAECDILVVTGLDPQTERHVIAHEAFHGILDHMGYHDIPARVVDALSFGVPMLVDDNPWLFKRVEEE